MNSLQKTINNIDYMCQRTLPIQIIFSIIMLVLFTNVTSISYFGLFAYWVLFASNVFAVWILYSESNLRLRLQEAKLDKQLASMDIQLKAIKRRNG